MWNANDDSLRSPRRTPDMTFGTTLFAGSRRGSYHKPVSSTPRLRVPDAVRARVMPPWLRRNATSGSAARVTSNAVDAISSVYGPNMSHMSYAVSVTEA